MYSRNRILNLLNEISKNSCRCPAHSSTNAININSKNSDYAFEMVTSTIRYGSGVTKEVGMDVTNMQAKRVLLVTDKNVSKIPTFQMVLDSLAKEKVNFEIYDEVKVEPTDWSVMTAVDFVRRQSEPFDLYIGFGGGSVLDTCKMMNLLSGDKEGSLMDYAAQPIGLGKPIRHKLYPMIGIPTTSGTGSETTGIAVFEYSKMKAKVGIGQRALKPTLGLVDPLHVQYLPRHVAIYSGFDVFGHSLESYTAIPYNERVPRPQNPIARPAYQGSNPISDVWSVKAFGIIQKYFKRSCADPSDTEAREQMHFASSIAGMGFGNAGVHLCHGMSYPISSLTPTYTPDSTSYVPIDRNTNKFWVPHGLSVIITAPAVFRYTSGFCPKRHLLAASILSSGSHNHNYAESDAGAVLSDVILKYMSDLGIPNGLKDLGFSADHIPQLVKGTLPQERVTKLSPRPVDSEDLENIFKDSLTVY